MPSAPADGAEPAGRVRVFSGSRGAKLPGGGVLRSGGSRGVGVVENGGLNPLRGCLDTRYNSGLPGKAGGANEAVAGWLEYPAGGAASGVRKLIDPVDVESRFGYN